MQIAVVTTQQSLLMEQALLHAVRHVELRLLAGATHAFGADGLQLAWTWASRFFAGCLKDKET